MLRELIAHSPDIEALAKDGYSLRVEAAHLVVEGVPYVTEAKEVARRGTSNGSELKKPLCDCQAS